MIINNKCYPDFFIIGAGKSGTTSLYRNLIRNKSVFMPEEIKEPSFFSYYNFKNKGLPIEGHYPLDKYITSLDKYEKLFENQEKYVCGEASVVYITYYKTTIENIKMIYGDNFSNIKIFSIIRNPIERAFSQYTMNIARGLENLKFSEAINPKTIQERSTNRRGTDFDYIAFGFYFKQLQSYFNAFKNVNVYLYDEYSNSQHTIINDVLRKLGLNLNPDVDTTRYEKTGKLKSKFLNTLLNDKKFEFIRSIKYLLPKQSRKKIRTTILSFNKKKVYMNKNDFITLKNIYKEDIKQTSILIKKDLSHWLDYEIYKQKTKD